ncbi:hypothetical protein B0A48_17904 [Cryoendolithus antarcticus]|uniref:Enterotoxin n=1 Tax=Cryoendolithus antarcticus TaxID=1507870 RepID=A0A1V8SAS5_9PEZI|nr:hypothetical protein B0A48_17904 [Cryoendolithus antarcticus]
MVKWLKFICLLISEALALPRIENGIVDPENDVITHAFRHDSLGEHAGQKPGARKAPIEAILQPRNDFGLASNVTDSPEVSSIVVLWVYIFPDNATLQAVTSGREFRAANDSSPETGWAQDTLSDHNITVIPYVYGTLNSSANGPGHLVERDFGNFVDLLVRGWKRVGNGARSFIEYIFGLSPKVVSEVYEHQDFSHLEWSTTESDERLLSEQARRKLPEGLSKIGQRPRHVQSRPIRTDSSGSVEEFEPATRKSTSPKEQGKVRSSLKAKAELRKEEWRLQKEAAKDREATQRRLRDSRNKEWHEKNPEPQRPQRPIDRPPPGQPDAPQPLASQPEGPQSPPAQPEIPQSPPNQSPAHPPPPSQPDSPTQDGPPRNGNGNGEMPVRSGDPPAPAQPVGHLLTEQVQAIERAEYAMSAAERNALDHEDFARWNRGDRFQEARNYVRDMTEAETQASELLKNAPSASKATHQADLNAIRDGLDEAKRNVAGIEEFAEHEIARARQIRGVQGRLRAGVQALRDATPNPGRIVDEMAGHVDDIINRIQADEFADAVAKAISETPPGTPGESPRVPHSSSKGRTSKPPAQDPPVEPPKTPQEPPAKPGNEPSGPPAESPKVAKQPPVDPPEGPKQPPVDPPKGPKQPPAKPPKPPQLEPNAPTAPKPPQVAPVVPEKNFLSQTQVEALEGAEKGIVEAAKNVAQHDANVIVERNVLAAAKHDLEGANTQLAREEELLKQAASRDRLPHQQKIRSLKANVEKAIDKVRTAESSVSNEASAAEFWKNFQSRTRSNIDSLRSVSGDSAHLEKAVSNLVKDIKGMDTELRAIQERIESFTNTWKDQGALDLDSARNAHRVESAKLNSLKEGNAADKPSRIAASEKQLARYQAEIKNIEAAYNAEQGRLAPDFVKYAELQNERTAAMEKLELFDVKQAKGAIPFEAGEAIQPAAEDLFRVAKPNFSPTAQSTGASVDYAQPDAGKPGEMVHRVNTPDAIAKKGSRGGWSEITPLDGAADEAAVDLFKGGKMTEAAAKPITEIMKPASQVLKTTGNAGAQGVLEGWRLTAQASNKLVGAVGEGLKNAVRVGRTIIKPAQAITAEAAEAAAAAGRVAGAVGADVAGTIGTEVVGAVAAEAAGEVGVIVLGKTTAAATAEILASAAARGVGVTVGVMARGAFELIAGPIGMAIGIAWMGGDLMYHTIKAKVMEHKCHKHLNKDYKTEFQRICGRPPASVPTRLKMWKAEAFKCDKLWSEKDYHKLKLNNEKGAKDLPDDHRFVNTHYIAPGEKPCDFGWYAKRALDSEYQPMNVTLITADGSFHFII